MNPLASPDPRFRAWLAERAPRLAPPGLLERSVRAAMAAPQADRWTLRWPILRYAAPIVATFAVVAIIGTALILWPPPAAIVDPSPPAASAAPEPTPRPTLAPTSTPPPSAAAPGSPAPVAAFREWTRIEMPDPAPDFLGGGTPIGVAAIGEGYVALGVVLGELWDADDTSGVAVWTSTDARTWDLREDVPSLTALRLIQLASGSERLVALGVSGISCCPTDEPNAAWTSTDAITWSPVDGAVPTRIATAGSTGLVGASVSDEGVRFMRSSDGSSWTDASAAFEGDFTDLAIDGSGRAVAVGHVTVDAPEDDSYATHVVAWESDAGAHWDERRIVARNAVARSIVAGPNGFVVVGHQTVDRVDGSRFDSARIWRLTASGLTPARLDFGEGQTLDRVFRIGDDLIATGTEIGELGDVVTAWHSADGGTTWARIPNQASLEGGVTTVTAMVGTPDGLLAVGHALDPESGHLVPVAWLAER